MIYRVLFFITVSSASRITNISDCCATFSAVSATRAAVVQVKLVPHEASPLPIAWSSLVAAPQVSAHVHTNYLYQSFATGQNHDFPRVKNCCLCVTVLAGCGPRVEEENDVEQEEYHPKSRSASTRTDGTQGGGD